MPHSAMTMRIVLIKPPLSLRKTFSPSHNLKVSQCYSASILIKIDRQPIVEVLEPPIPIPLTSKISKILTLPLS